MLFMQTFCYFFVLELEMELEMELELELELDWGITYERGHAAYHKKLQK